MSAAISRLNVWFTQAAVGRHLSYRTGRTRLTLIYGGLFVLSGAALMAIAYVLLVNAGFIFTQPNSTAGVGSAREATPPVHLATRQGFPHAGLRTHPSAQTMSYWRGVAGCMRRHGIRSFPDPTDTVPRSSY